MRLVYRRGVPTAIAAAIVLTVILFASSFADAAPSSRGEVRTASPVEALGVGGSLAAYSLQTSCKLHSWSLATGRLASFDVATDCSSSPSFAHVAIVSDAVVWSELEEHNHLYLEVEVARTANPSRAKSLYDAIDEDLGALAAEGDAVAFSTQGGFYDSGPRATLWVGTTTRVSALQKAVGWMDRVAVEGDVVALGYRDGRVRLFRTSGKRILALREGTAVAGLALEHGRLLTLARARVSVRTLAGKTVLARPIRGPSAQAELLDARNGLVAYRVGTRLRVLRLTDTRDVLIQTPRTPIEYLHAGFGESGLVVAHLAESGRPARGGIVRLVDNRELDRLLAQSP